MQKAPWCVLNKVKLTEAGYRCAFWEHAPFTKHVTKKLVSHIKAETVTDKLSQPAFTASPWSAPWFPRCHSGLPRRESSAFPAWHLHLHHSEGEALHSQVLGGRVEKSQPFQRFFKRKIISKAVLQDLLFSSQDWQCCGLGMSTLGTQFDHLLWVQFNRNATDKYFPVLLCDPQSGALRVLRKSSPGPDEESVLDQNSDEEEHRPLHGHGEEVSSHQVPREWRDEAVLPW